MSGEADAIAEVLAWRCIVVDVLSEFSAKEGNATEGSDGLVSGAEALGCITGSAVVVESAVVGLLGAGELAVERSTSAEPILGDGVEEASTCRCIVVGMVTEFSSEAGSAVGGADGVGLLAEALRCTTGSDVVVKSAAVVFLETDKLAVERSTSACWVEVSRAAVEISLR